MVKSVSLCEAIWRIESENGLLERQIAGVHYWPLVRLQIHETLSHKLGLHESLEPVVRPPLPKRIFRHLVPLVTHARMLPWRAGQTVNTILVPFGRKHIRDGRAVDILSERVLSEPEFGPVMVLDRQDSTGMYQPGPGWIVRSADVVRSFALTRAAFRLPEILPAASKEVRILNGFMNRECGFGFPFSAYKLAVRVAAFREGRAISRQIIKRSGARRLFVVGAPSANGTVAAANDLGLITAEFQHGIITPYHMMYHYPGCPVVPYAPAHLLTFGKFWGANIELPANTTATVIGSEHLAQSDLRRVARVSRQVLIVSQGSIGPRLFDAAVVAARDASEWQFIFRPHPQENFDDFQARLRALPRAPRNFRVSKPSEEFYPLLASAAVQIGVYSTAMFEGMALGVRTIVLAFAGSEHMARPIEIGDAVIARRPEDIASLLSTAPATSNPEKYYAPPVPSIAAMLK